jgi:NTP pyrophosphatase (non-canonical NTP hydrolase)
MKVGQSFCLKTKLDWNQIRVFTVVDYRLFVQRDILLSVLQVPVLGSIMSSAKPPTDELSIGDLQRHIRQMYYEKDVARGVEGTFMWLMEEVGELASALRGNDRENLAEEFADVIAWLATIANVANVDLNAALVAKYGSGCPGCGRLECQCPDSEKP